MPDPTKSVLEKSEERRMRYAALSCKKMIGDTKVYNLSANLFCL